MSPSYGSATLSNELTAPSIFSGRNGWATGVGGDAGTVGSMGNTGDGTRRFRGIRKVRLGDATPTARLRLDALTRYTQDVSDDDTTDAGLAPDPGWVVRRTRVEVGRPATLAETLTFTTWCTGLGRRWAERHLSIVGDQGAAYEVSTLWICVDLATGRPCPLTDQFLTIYGPAAGDRKVTARSTHPKPVVGAPKRTWPLRAVDFDTLGHVNNAAYWAAVEEVLAAGSLGDGPGEVAADGGGWWAEIEYRDGLDLGDEVTLLMAEVDPDRDPGSRSRTGLWWVTDGGGVAATALVGPQPA